MDKFRNLFRSYFLHKAKERLEAARRFKRYGPWAEDWVRYHEAWGDLFLELSRLFKKRK